MAKFLSGLDASLGNQVCGQILGDTVPPLTTTVSLFSIENSMGKLTKY